MVTGHVQGVGFRYFVLRRADGLGLDGWVRNEANRSVEIEASGDRAALEQFIAAVRPGPRGARVEEFMIEWQAEAAPGTKPAAGKARAGFKIL